MSLVRVIEYEYIYLLLIDLIENVFLNCVIKLVN